MSDGKIMLNGIVYGGGTEINDNAVASDATWSSSRIVGLLPTDTASGAIASFDDGADDVPIVSGIFDIVATQAGSGDPSPDNVRAISGFTGCNIVKAGKNLCKPYAFTAGIYSYSSNGKIKVSGTVSSTAYTPTTSQATSNNLCFVLKAGTYTPSVLGTLPTGAFINVVSEDNVSLSQGAAFTLSEETKVFYRIVVPAGTYDFETYAQIERGTTATAYEPYNANVYNVDWTTEAGTVYGGSLNATTGVLTITHQNITSYTGETINEPWESSMDVYASGTTPSTGAQVVYPLATPITYQLTPQQINTLLGSNNIYCDTGDSSVTYRADVQKYIDKKIASLNT